MHYDVPRHVSIICSEGQSTFSSINLMKATFELFLGFHNPVRS